MVEFQREAWRSRFGAGLETLRQQETAQVDMLDEQAVEKHNKGGVVQGRPHRLPR
jgi:hypothetical protein